MSEPGPTLPLPIGASFAAVRPPASALVLVCAHGGELRSVALPDGGDLVIGRDPGVALSFADSALSRQHARFERRGDQVTVVDLDSSNGTFVDGQRIRSHALRSGDQVVLGAVVVSLQRFEASPSRSGLAGHDAFRRALADELLRVRGTGRPAVVALVAPAAETAQGAWVAALRAQLRAFDRAARYGRDVAELLLPECTAGDAVGVVQQLAARLGTPVRAGLAEIPAAGHQLEQVLGATRAALDAATPQQPIVVAPAVAIDRPVAIDAPVVVSPRMLGLYAHAGRAAVGQLPVLVRGETGAGKELVARVIHDHGMRKAGPFVSINCGALPDTLIQGALFGHERGAFTGADRQTPGVFEQAHRGTLFLDEIGELSAVAQASLLRVLETGTLTRLGGTQPVTVDVRVVAATHRDLEQMSQTGAFRADLWFRLGALVIEIPPLRERPEDLRPLVDRFVAAAARATGRAHLTIEDAALACLAAYPWPGNVRELRNEIERAAVLATGDVIRATDLSPRVARAAASGVPPTTAPHDDDDDDDDDVDDDAPGEPIDAGGDLKTRVERFEAEVIRQALAAANNHQPTAARALGIPLRTLVYKLRKHNLQRNR